mmetsp:Transcript_22484/g.35184  ORF Transcript_22484/g.35184 Transcript_22484/m.35184 type:complete len:130 (-) Transcript_22484:1005-1394(-)
MDSRGTQERRGSRDCFSSRLSSSDTGSSGNMYTTKVSIFSSHFPLRSRRLQGVAVGSHVHPVESGSHLQFFDGKIDLLPDPLTTCLHRRPQSPPLSDVVRLRSLIEAVNGKPINSVLEGTSCEAFLSCC